MRAFFSAFATLANSDIPGLPQFYGHEQALDRLNPTFCKLYASRGRHSVPPDQLLLAWLLQAFYGMRSERLLLMQLHDNLLLRWFVGLNPDDPIWHATTDGLRPTSSTPKTASDCSTTK